MSLMKAYNRLPISLQNLACTYEGYRIKRFRYNKDFYNIYREYEERSTWSYERLCEFRDKRLQEMVRYCYENIPFYQKTFKEYGINYESIKTLDDLKKLPIINKEIVKKYQKEFISKNYKGKISKVRTSGTTGSGLIVYSSQNTIHEQFSVFMRARNSIGINQNDWYGVFGGRSIVPIQQNKPPFWRINHLGKQIYFSVFHLNEDNIKYYIQEIDRRKLKWIHGYPSALNLIATYMIENNIRLSYKIDFITTGSENLLDNQKDVILRAFGVVPYQHYGQAENVAIFSERKDHRIFVDEDFSAVEFVKDPLNNESRIIGSTLNNYVMPLLRYDIGDNAIFKETNEGREILKIDGRNEDYIILSNGNKVGRLAHIFSHMVNIAEAQIIQKEIGEITIRIVRGANYTEKDEQELLNRLQSKIGYSEVINLKYLKKIPRTKNGKLRFIISNIK